MMDDICGNIRPVRALVDAAFKEADTRDITRTPSLSLAYIGDTVFDLYVRTYLVEREDAKVHELHLMSAKRVCAAGQAEAFFKIESMLTEEELAVYKRGRNSHMGTVAKNAKISDYRVATGLEALIGCLYLRGEDERLTELMRVIFKTEE